MSDSREKSVEAYLRLGSVTAAARELGLARGTVQYHLRRANLGKPVAAGSKTGSIRERKASLPTTGEVKRYLLTCAQNNAYVHPELWKNLLAFKSYMNAELMVSQITYNINAYTAQPAKPGSRATDKKLWYDPVLEQFVSNARVELAPGLVWCGEANILPTAERPLRGFETYTGRKSGVFPHTKLAMDSIASGKHEATKFNYTTGCVTQMAYIQRKAGQKAEFHHAYGALLVEVDSRGRWFVRQLNALRDGSFQDLDLVVSDGKVTKGHRVEAINWGDIHEEQLDEQVRELAWGKGGMLDTLKPKYQFMHDSLSFHRRNHHDRGDPHLRFLKFVRGQESVREELRSLARFLKVESARDWCKTLIVNSNHDNALERWLREADYRADPPNAILFLELQLQKYRALAADDGGFLLLEWALRQEGLDTEVQFLREDESFLLCGEIECGMHGHLGPDGTKGTPFGLARMGRKANTGHTHKAGIIDGQYTSGTSSQLDLGYNKGPGSWSHSHIVTYPNGKRAIVTMWNGAWRAT